MRVTFCQLPFLRLTLLPLALGGLVIFVGSFFTGCTLIAEVDRTKIPDESAEGMGGADAGDDQSMAGSDSN